jgi:hypothetical protein
VILQGRFCDKVRSGYKGVRMVSMLRLTTARRCTTGCFAMAGERALPRFVNCWSMTGVFRRRSKGVGPRAGQRERRSAACPSVVYRRGRNSRYQLGNLCHPGRHMC